MISVSGILNSKSVLGKEAVLKLNKLILIRNLSLKKSSCFFTVDVREARFKQSDLPGCFKSG